MERNAIGLPSFTAKQVSGRLDALLSSFSTQYHQYMKHHWVVAGPDKGALYTFFEESFRKTEEHVDAIAERMTTLGAVPTSSMQSQSDKSLLEAESEGIYPVRDMLKSDLENEQALISYIGEAVSEACELKDYGTETLLKRVLMEREILASEMMHFLGNDSLARRPEPVGL